MSRALVALVALVAAAAALGSAPVFAGPHVDVSVSVGQPGLYGRVDLGHGGYGPVVAYPQPVYLPAPAPVAAAPVAAPTPPQRQRQRARPWSRSRRPRSLKGRGRVGRAALRRAKDGLAARQLCVRCAGLKF